MTIAPHQPPGFVKRFWRSDFGRKTIRVLEPSKWWTIAFSIAVIAVIVWTLTIYRQQARDEAAHAAEIVANADGQYTACLVAIPIAERINAFIAGEKIIRNTLVRNSLANHLADPTNPVKLANYQRLRRARAEAYQVRFPVATPAVCLARRTKVFGDARQKAPPLPAKS